MDKPSDMQFQFSVPQPPPAGAVPLTAEQAEQALLDQLAAAKDDSAQMHDRAMDQFRLLLDRVPSLEAKAQIVLALGQTAEKEGDFEMAAGFYRQALSMEPADPQTWYFVLNNLAFSLNQLGRFEEAVSYCWQAIKTVPGRLNDAGQCVGPALAGPLGGVAGRASRIGI